MKNLLTIIFMLIAAVAFAQEADDLILGTEFSAVKEFFLPAVLGIVISLFSDAGKYVFTSKWSWGKFFSTKIKPFLISLAGGVALYYLFAFLPFTQSFIEALAGSDLTEVTAIGLMGLATTIVDGFLKKDKDTDEEIQV